MSIERNPAIDEGRGVFMTEVVSTVSSMILDKGCLGFFEPMGNTRLKVPVEETLDINNKDARLEAIGEMVAHFCWFLRVVTYTTQIYPGVLLFTLAKHYNPRDFGLPSSSTLESGAISRNPETNILQEKFSTRGISQDQQVQVMNTTGRYYSPNSSKRHFTQFFEHVQKMKAYTYITYPISVLTCLSPTPSSSSACAQAHERGPCRSPSQSH